MTITCLVLLLAVEAFALEEIRGTPVIVDGDTLQFGRQRVILYGIDAPERRQTCQNPSGQPYNCGMAAAEHLRQLIREREVICDGSDWNNRRHIIAECHAGPLNLNAAMVRDGWAVAYTNTSDHYLFQETLARTQQGGLWQGDFVKPWDWRDGVR